MLLSKSRRLLFIHIYKNAGTSITEALLPFAAPKMQRRLFNLCERYNLPNTYLDPQPYPIHISAPELIEVMGAKQFNSYYSFAFVRNPWDWQVSLYNYMLGSPDHYQYELIQSFESFDQYLEWRCCDDVRFQKDFIYSADGELLVDFVGRFENIDADFQQVCSRIGIETTLPRLNVSNATPYRQFYNERTIELVRQVFEPDIALFGYDF